MSNQTAKEAIQQRLESIKAATFGDVEEGQFLANLLEALDERPSTRVDTARHRLLVELAFCGTFVVDGSCFVLRELQETPSFGKDGPEGWWSAQWKCVAGPAEGLAVRVDSHISLLEKGGAEKVLVDAAKQTVEKDLRDPTLMLDLPRRNSAKKDQHQPTASEFAEELLLELSMRPDVEFDASSQEQADEVLKRIPHRQRDRVHVRVRPQATVRDMVRAGEPPRNWRAPDGRFYQEADRRIGVVDLRCGDVRIVDSMDLLRGRGWIENAQPVEVGARVYHRKADGFARVESIADGTATILYEWPWKEGSTAKVPLAQLVHDFEAPNGGM